MTVNLDLVSLNTASGLEDTPDKLVDLQSLQESGLAASDELMREN